MSGCSGSSVSHRYSHSSRSWSSWSRGRAGVEVGKGKNALASDTNSFFPGTGEFSPADYGQGHFSRMEKALAS